MFPVYEEKKKNLHIHLRTLAHASPHLHNSIEFIYITEGTLELGMGQELLSYGRGRSCSDLSGCDPSLSGVLSGRKQSSLSLGKAGIDWSVCGYHSEQLSGRPGYKKGAGASGYCKCGTVSQGKPQGEG